MASFNPFQKKKSRESSRERSDKGGDHPDAIRVATSPSMDRMDLPPSVDPPENPDYPNPNPTMIDKEGGARRKTTRPLPQVPPESFLPTFPGAYPTKELQELTKLEESTQDQFYEERRKKEEKKERQRLRNRERKEEYSSSSYSSDDQDEEEYYEDFYETLERPVTHKIKYFIEEFYEDEGDYKYLLKDDSTIAAHDMDKPTMDKLVSNLQTKGVKRNPTAFEKTQGVIKRLKQKWKNIQQMQRRSEAWNKTRSKKTSGPGLSPAKEVIQGRRPLRSQKSESWSPVKTPGKASKDKMGKDKDWTSSDTNMIQKLNRELERNREETEELRAQVKKILGAMQEQRKPEKARDARKVKIPPKVSKESILKYAGSKKKDSVRKQKKEDSSDGSKDSRSTSQETEESEDQELEVNMLGQKTNNQQDNDRLEVTDPEDFDETFWARIQKDSPPAKVVKFHNHFDILAKGNIIKVFERIASNYSGNGNIIARLEETARAFIGLGISRDCFVRFFADQLLTNKEKERVSIVLKNITSIKDLIESLKKFILSGDGSVREEQSANRWIKEAFAKDADISAISTECMVRAKKIVASQSDFSTVTHEIVTDRTESKARQLLLGGISNYAKEDILDRIVESGAFNESSLQGLTQKVLPFFQPKLRRAVRNNNLRVEQSMDGTEVEVMNLQRTSLEQTMKSFMDQMERKVKEVKDQVEVSKGKPPQQRTLDPEEPSQELESIYTLVNNLMNQRSRRYPANITPNTICYECDMVGDHTAFDCPTKPRTAKGMMVCYNCGESGHTRMTCPKKRPTFSSTQRTACNMCKAKGLTTEECKQRPLHCFYHENQPYPHCTLCPPRPKN